MAPATAAAEAGQIPTVPVHRPAVRGGPAIRDLQAVGRRVVVAKLRVGDAGLRAAGHHNGQPGHQAADDQAADLQDGHPAAGHPARPPGAPPHG